MKNILMLILVFAAILTGIYRLLPVETQHYVLVQIDKIAQLKSVLPGTSISEPKKYLLDVSDSKTSTQQKDFLVVASAYIQHLQNVQVQGEGRVVKILSDDRDGSKHQLFILRTPEDITVLIAHNIDLAPRINNLIIGDTVYFNGEYVWNEKGGVVHWTHRDPNGRHAAGFLKYNGFTFQ